ncbi:MAG: V-type ATP synthase subunit F [Clostridia bacterium]|nr:V-type ATP synthase subunit F [Clostridia bacterium]MDR3644796.1 V-type ATP synthase subunit F [Clostridia bacterium]
MRFYLISDNIDTYVGMRLAGIEGTVVHSDGEVREALKGAMDDKEIGIVLITEKLVSICPDLVYDLKLNRRRPLIVEIPDRHGSGRSKDSITRYVREAIGVKI